MTKVKNAIKMKGVVKLELFDKDGRLKQVVEKENDIVNAGLDWLKEFAFDSVNPTSKTRMSHIAIGTGVTAVDPTDTTLATEAARAAFDNYVAGGTGVMTVDVTFAAGTGTGAITEVGTFNDASAGEMWNRVVFSAVNKTATDALKVTVTVTFTEV
jgi:hypothetical protein